ncbi:MAG: ComF family protein [Deltaproteobacteria bacterium]
MWSPVEWFFKPRCVACSNDGSPFCESCASSLVELGAACPRCAEPTGAVSAICRRCLRSPLPLERIVSPWRFGGPLASAIRRLKFTGANQIARSVAPLWAPLVAAAASEGGVVVPIPLHWRRRFSRGYDHAWLLALHACASAQIAPPVPVLARTRASPAQSSLAAADRRSNLRGVFAVRRRYASRIVDREIVLLDDVVTTGSTLAAACEALLEGGARSVTGVALARTAQ